MKEVKNRANPRLPEYDYNSPGAYFLTLCTKNRANLLANIYPKDAAAVGRDDSGAPPTITQGTSGCAVGRDDHGAPLLRLTKTGKIVDRYINSIGNAYSNVSVDAYVVMPNHVHLLLSVTLSDGAPGSSRPTAASDNEDASMQPRSAMLIPRIVAALKRFTNKDAGMKLWQDYYYDHIIRDENDYYIKLNYIEQNVLKWAEDEYYSHL